MSVQDQYINSVNLNLQTDFPYLVLNVEDDVSYPLNPGFRVMHWHEDLQFIYVIRGTICVKTLDEEEIISAGEGVFINKNLVHMVEKMDSCKYKSFVFPDFFVSFYFGSPAVRLTQNIIENTEKSLVVLYDSNQWCHQALLILRELVEIEEGERSSLYPLRSAVKAVRTLATDAEKRFRSRSSSEKRYQCPHTQILTIY